MLCVRSNQRWWHMHSASNMLRCLGNAPLYLCALTKMSHKQECIYIFIYLINRRGVTLQIYGQPQKDKHFHYMKRAALIPHTITISSTDIYKLNG